MKMESLDRAEKSNPTLSEPVLIRARPGPARYINCHDEPATDLNPTIS